MKLTHILPFLVRQKSRIQVGSLIFSFFLILIALIGPNISFFQSLSFQASGTNISFVVDVSKSMEAQDFLDEQGANISRGDGVKLLIQYMLGEFPNNAYSLSVFAGETLRILPFTDDKNIFLTFLSGVSSQSVVRQGTDVKKALDAGLEAFSTDTQSGALVIFSDGGEESVSGLQSYKEAFTKKHISLLVIGVGSQEGSFIPTGVDVFGNPVYKTYNGQRVVTRVDSTNLKNLALDLGGGYVEIANFSDRGNLLRAISKLQSTQTLREKKGDTDTGSFLFFTFLSFCSFLVFLSLYFLPFTVGIRK